MLRWGTVRPLADPITLVPSPRSMCLTGGLQMILCDRATTKPHRLQPTPRQRSATACMARWARGGRNESGKKQIAKGETTRFESRQPTLPQRVMLSIAERPQEEERMVAPR